MIKITQEEINSEITSISVRIPKKFSNRIKAEAALRGISKDELFKRLLIAGCKDYSD